MCAFHHSADFDYLPERPSQVFNFHDLRRRAAPAYTPINSIFLPNATRNHLQQKSDGVNCVSHRHLSDSKVVTLSSDSIKSRARLHYSAFPNLHSLGVYAAGGVIGTQCRPFCRHAGPRLQESRTVLSNECYQELVAFNVLTVCETLVNLGPACDKWTTLSSNHAFGWHRRLNYGDCGNAL